MPNDARPSPNWKIEKVEGQNVFVIEQMFGDFHISGSLDTQPLNFDYLIAKSAVQARILFENVQSSGRYNAETYEPRPEIEQHINRFLVSPQTGLLILGESGVGKTNVLAHLCQQLVNDRQVVLFYSGRDFFEKLNVEQRILEDCGSIHKIPSLGEFFDTLDSLNQVPEHPTSFVVLVDSVETASDPPRLLRVLDSVIRNVSYSWFKVIITIQTGTYEAIADEHDKLDWQPIAPRKYYLPDGSTTSPLPGVALEPFNLTELQGAWNKAQLSVSLKSLPETSRNLIRHPYFFKLFAELYKSGADRASLFAISTPWELSKRYYKTRLPSPKRRRNPSRVLLNELIGKLLEKRFIWFSILELTEDATIGRYFIDYKANKPYANLLNFGFLQEHVTLDVKVSFKPNPLFAYALYQYFREYDNLTVEYLISIVTELLPGPMSFRLEDVANQNDLDERDTAIQYFRILRSFWYLPMVEAIAYLLVDRWKMGKEEAFVIKFLVESFRARAWWATEGISVKFIEAVAREIPETLEQVIPSVLASYASLFAGSNSPPFSFAENRLFPNLFDDLVENALTQEATSIINALLSGRKNSPDEIVELYLVLAKVHGAAHNDEQRLANLLEANKHTLASGNVAKMGRVANSIGVFYNETGGDPAAAIQWLERGLEFAAKAGQPRESIAASHFNIGLALADQRNFSRAIPHLEQSLALLDKKQAPLRAAEILTKIGEIQTLQRNFEQALNAYQQAVALFEAYQQEQPLAILYLNLGNLYKEQGVTSQAVEYYHKSHPLLLKYGMDELAAKLQAEIKGV